MYVCFIYTYIAIVIYVHTYIYILYIYICIFLRYLSPFSIKAFSDVTKDEFPSYICICIKGKNLQV